MSLIRALTTRRNRPQKLDSSFSRTASQRSPVMRHQISSPVALISSTNTLAYEAPDIVGTMPVATPTIVRNVSSSSSINSSGSSSADDSDASSTSMHSSGTITDASSVDEPTTPTSPEPNHLSCYFKPAVSTSGRESQSNSATSSPRPSFSFDAPAVPQRAPSHSKKAHVQLSRKRSVQRGMVRNSADMFSASIEPPVTHPFGKELEQLTEVAEEFGSTCRAAEADADRVFMEAHGLARFTAAEYMTEIQDLWSDCFQDEPAPEYAAWI
ncbi:hypothetical protein H2203_004678 [Taxawa tesnikishii (nom. ined.)]|nr:hypothetical protein H2203_004678 [Dothideales sp. JES 119]